MNQFRINSLSAFLFLLCFAGMISCDDDFLYRDKNIDSYVSDTIRMSNFDADLAVSFNLPQAKDAKWSVFQMPVWMSISPMEGLFVNGKSSFVLQLKDSYAIPQWGLLDLPLVFDVEGIGYVQYPFQMTNYGTPRATISPYSLNMEYQSAAAVSLQNLDGGILLWKVQEKPSWLDIVKSEGVLSPGESEILNISISRDKLPKGDYSGTIVFATNTFERRISLSVTMKVFDPTMSGDVTPIEGEVVDADFCKASGMMVFASKNPNKLYLIPAGQNMVSMDLNKVPINVSISEDGSLLAATFTNTDLSLIDPYSHTITKSIQTGIISSDLALGNNGWAYLSPKPYDSNYLKSVNLETDEVIENTENVNGLSLLKKVPGKDLLYGTKTGWSPDFLVVYDISKGAASNEVHQWWADLWKFWIFEQGDRIFAGRGKIFNSPAYLQKPSNSDKLVLAGEIEELSGYITSMDHCAILKEMFVVYKSYSYQLGTQVLRIDDSGYVTKSVFTVSPCNVVDNGNFTSIIPDVPYVFVNQSGSELCFLKKASGNSGKVYWFFEKINLYK